MIVSAVKTEIIHPSRSELLTIIDESLSGLSEGSIVAITSKIVSLCEGQVVPADESQKAELIRQESDYYMTNDNKYGFNFTLKNNTLIPMSGIDESNGDGYYILWPKDPQRTANEVRKHLKDRFSLKEVGVVITDSTCMPMRWGTVGIALAYSGFAATNNYIGGKDLFGRPFKVSRSGIASGIAASAVLAMGEGTEQTPIVIIEDVPFVRFQDHDPTQDELELFHISNKDDDLFAPLLNSVNWLPGSNKK